ncbi:uncharacterized protein [Heterodontus francisci]|uniref:uncharacterized protein n=1 Tax=Heterodontus francisci TaxID=7792 RepID=UPI00355B1896
MAREYFSCAYQRRLMDRLVFSGRSNLLAITTRNPLSKPELILNVTSGIYWKEQIMTMTCKGELQELEGLFYFYRDGNAAQADAAHSFQTVRVPGSDRQGLHQCKYALSTPTKWFESPFSQGVRVTEIGDLPRPSIFLEGDNRVFLAGESIIIKCRAPPEETGQRFLLYQNLGLLPVLSKEAEAGNRSVAFDIRNVTRSGNYAYRLMI